ncbi:hypothetical protein EDB84DRAFT_1566623 [Lactarius hengduanensis]|nr:hypothetical protein EDB84DRAFT_1566623 [Lactarius hengduanensis]
MAFECINSGQILEYIISYGRLRERVARKFGNLKIESILSSQAGDHRFLVEPAFRAKIKTMDVDLFPQSMLVTNPQQRASIPDLLNHPRDPPWFQWAPTLLPLFLVNFPASSVSVLVTGPLSFAVAWAFALESRELTSVFALSQNRTLFMDPRVAHIPLPIVKQ